MSALNVRTREVRLPSDRGYPWCTVCNKEVESFEIETPVARNPWSGQLVGHTGEVIVTIKCHGEKWKQSFVARSGV